MNTLSRHHHRRHSRGHHSNNEDEAYFIPNEKSPIDSNYIEIKEDCKADNTLWENTVCTNELDENKLECDDCNNIGSISFIDNLKKHTGKKATIYTSGGDSRMYNFTGVLIGVNHCFIRLALNIAEAPVYEPENNYNDNLNPYNDILPFDNCNSEQNCKNDDISTFVDIPIDKITGFIHGNI
ncbi:hypothetical protein CKR_0993 [Clostridium kluyveri NBRC 12016]|uniref:Uncharacterized protein n=1 Tax=Clostridium kluyveri (strain NBRC 12016) TaxID=583346 RepID=B9E0L9_CLOK1|nr:hypothetical protein CKR_0993 [Clostridium kluyveri NBRC 12016]